MYIAVALENYKFQVSQITKTSIQSLERALERRTTHKSSKITVSVCSETLLSCRELRHDRTAKNRRSFARLELQILNFEDSAVNGEELLLISLNILIKTLIRFQILLLTAARSGDPSVRIHPFAA